MRERLLDLLERLVGVQEALGDEAFNLACQRAKLAVARVAMEHATNRATRKALPSTVSDAAKESRH
ncbi:hypothetical protein [Devosia sediminis]|uniref:Uncharacterized protein n=1 Tax=Devosia sediminis TaxID=2798801 RepID=A0A934J018_9HYPH|nr:hypothetical protein [Devosia sediminis]MBJ3786401.1 hypothetical protein [Devosia sediminis]